MAVEDQALHEEGTEVERLKIALGIATERVYAPVAIYIHMYPIYALLKGKCSSCVEWSILRGCANKLRISKACAPL